jgi:hypothetical protein
VKLTKKLMLVTSALVLPISAVVLVGATSASASRSLTVQTGTIHCTGVKGTITFTPPEKTGGSAIETSTIVKVTVSKCKADPTASAVPTKGAVSTNIASGTGTNNCSSLVGVQNTPQTLNVTWTPASDGTSSSTYSNYDAVTSPKAGFQLPDPSSSPPGTGSTSNSYAQASGSSALALSSKTSTQLLAACNSAGGLKSIKITKGNTTL